MSDAVDRLRNRSLRLRDFITPGVTPNRAGWCRVANAKLPISERIAGGLAPCCQVAGTAIIEHVMSIERGDAKVGISVSLSSEELAQIKQLTQVDSDSEAVTPQPVNFAGLPTPPA